MDKILKIIRKIHLYASFIIASFLLMYFLSGGVMIMGKIFPRNYVLYISEKVAIKNNQSEKDAVNAISLQYNIYGEERLTTTSNGGRNYIITRPDYKAEIIFTAGKDSIQVKISKGTFWSVLNYFHRLHGYAGSRWPHKVWGVLYDLSCIALLVFAISGVYLWWKLERKKLPGILFIFLSTGLTVFTIWYLFAVC